MISDADDIVEELEGVGNDWKDAEILRFHDCLNVEVRLLDQEDDLAGEMSEKMLIFDNIKMFHLQEFKIGVTPDYDEDGSVLNRAINAELLTNGISFSFPASTFAI